MILGLGRASAPAMSEQRPGVAAGTGAAEHDPDVIEGSTEVEQETFAFLWTLKRFSAFTGMSEVKSPTFRGGPQSNHTWQLKMNPRKMVDDMEYFAVHLLLTGFGVGDASPNRKIKARFQISLLEGEGRPGKQAGSSTMNPCEFRKLTVWGYDKFILFSELVGASRRFMVDDSLQIYCRVWIEGDLKHTVDVNQGPEATISADEMSRIQKDNLARDLGNLLQDSVGTDIKVIASGGQQACRAHKAILAARSSVFRAMFNTNMIERDQNEVRIPDFDPLVVKGMIEFIYTGTTERIYDVAPDLLMIAEKYDLKGLKDQCEREIAQNLCADNASEVLVMAHIYGAQMLKQKVTDFITRNKEAVKTTESFKRNIQTHGTIFMEIFL